MRANTEEYGNFECGTFQTQADKATFLAIIDAVKYQPYERTP